VTALLLRSALRENSNNLTKSCTAIVFLCLQLSAHQPMWILQHYIMSHPCVSGVTLSKKRKEKTTPVGNEKPSTVLCRAAQGFRGTEVVLARLVVPPIASSLQRISAIVLWVSPLLDDVV